MAYLEFTFYKEGTDRFDNAPLYARKQWSVQSRFSMHYVAIRASRSSCTIVALRIELISDSAIPIINLQFSDHPGVLKAINNNKRIDINWKKIGVVIDTDQSVALHYYYLQ